MNILLGESGTTVDTTPAITGTLSAKNMFVSVKRLFWSEILTMVNQKTFFDELGGLTVIDTELTGHR